MTRMVRETFGSGGTSDSTETTDSDTSDSTESDDTRRSDQGSAGGGFAAPPIGDRDSTSDSGGSDGGSGRSSAGGSTDTSSNGGDSTTRRANQGTGGGFAQNPLGQTQSESSGDSGTVGTGGADQSEPDKFGDLSQSELSQVADAARESNRFDGSDLTVEDDRIQVVDEALERERQEAFENQIQDRNERVISAISGQRTAQQQSKQRARQEARESFGFQERVIGDFSGQRTAQQQTKQRARSQARENQIPEFNEEVISELSSIRTGQQQEMRRARAQFREQAAEQFSENVAGDVPESAIVLEQTEDGLSASLDREIYEAERDRPLGNIQETEEGRALIDALDAGSRAINEKLVDPAAEAASDLNPLIWAERAAQSDERLTGVEDIPELFKEPEEEGALERRTEAATRGAGTAIDVPGAARTLINIGDFAGAGAAEAVQGRGGNLLTADGEDIFDSGDEIAESFITGDTVDVRAFEGGFAEEAQERGAFTTDRAITQAQENPGVTASTLAGGLLGTAAFAGGASLISPTAGKSAAFAFQPAEEIATTGATAVAQRSALGNRLLSRIPGETLDPEDVAIRSGQRLKAGVSKRLQTNARNPDDVVDLGVGERLPDVRVTTEGRAGGSPVDVNVNQNALPSTPDIGSRLPSRPSRPDISRPSIPDTPSFGFKTETDLTSSARAQAQVAAAQAERPFIRARQAVERAPARVEQARLRAGRTLDETAGQLRGRLQGSARVERDGGPEIPNLVGNTRTSRATVDDVTPSLPSIPTLDVNLRQSVAAQTEATATQARESIGALPGRVGQARARAGRTAGDVRTGLSDVFTEGYLQRTDSETDIAGLTPEEQSRRMLDEDRFQADQSAGDRFAQFVDETPAVNVVDRLSSLADTRVRVDVGLPSRQTRFIPETEGEGLDVDVPPGVIEAEAEGDLPYTPGEGDFETSTGQSGGLGAFETEARGESGVAVQRVVQAETETETEPSRPTRRRASEAPFDTTETFFDESVFSDAFGDGLSFDDLSDVTQPTLQETPLALGNEVDQTPFEFEGERELEFEQEQEQETEFEQETETETEIETEFEQELELEAEQEQEFEFEFEFETENELEFEGFPLQDRLGEQRNPRGAGGIQGEFLTDFVNPLTGETIETTDRPGLFE